MRRLLLALMACSMAVPAGAQVIVSGHNIIHVAPIPPQPVAPLAPSVAVVSTAYGPALNGTYTVDANAVSNITSIVTGIAAQQGFPGGASTFVYVDASGKGHTFPSTDEFVAFGAAIRNYVYAAQMAGMGQAATMPAVPLVIP